MNPTGAAPSARPARPTRLVDWTSARALLKHLGDARWLLLGGFALIAVDALAQISAPAVFREVLIRIEEDPQAFVRSGWRGPAIAAGVVSVTFVTSAYFAHTLTRRGAARWADNLRRQLYEHVQRLSVDYFHSAHVGDVTARINQDIERLETSITHLRGVFWSSTVMLAAVALMTWIDIWMGLLGVGLLGIAAIWTVLLLPRLRHRTRVVRDHLGTTSGTIAELLGATPLIKAFNAELDAAQLVSVESTRTRLTTERLARLQFRYADLLGFHVAFVAPFVLLFVGAWRAADGTLHIGDVVAIWAFWQRASGALYNLTNNVPELFNGITAGERAAELLAEVPAVADVPGATPLRIDAAAIRFRDVSFAYPSRPGHPVLDHVELDVHPGERVALVGPSGAGKSTIAQLVLRFYDPTSGTVEIDGQDLRRVDQASVRQAIGIVFQDNVLLSGTLARNLRLARSDATDDELWAALESANALGFVRSWPDGLDTRVGERGVMLSGGQRQRIAIARVMLKDPAVVILDEATSALDADSERLVLAAFERLLEGRTSLVITHRIATIRQANRILVLENGSVTAGGTHEELLERSPTYRSYCREQFVV